MIRVQIEKTENGNPLEQSPQEQTFADPLAAATFLLERCSEGQLKDLRSGKIGQLIRSKRVIGTVEVVQKGLANGRLGEIVSLK